MKKHTLFQGAMVAALTTSAIVIVPTAQAAEKFTDVDYTKEYGAAVKDLAARGIIKGYADGTFKPFADVTRGQAARIVAGLLGLDTKNVVDPNFKDVKQSDEFYGAIAALENAGITSGLADGSFGVNQAITREQLAQMLTAAYHLETEGVGQTLPFKDIVKYSDAYYAVAPLFENNITKGITPTTFGVKETVKRSQLALFIHRIEAMQAKRVIQTFTASELGSNYIEAYASANLAADGEHEFFRILRTNNDVKVEALREGSGYFMLIGFNMDNEDNYEIVEMQKYKIDVTKVDGKLQINCQPTDEVTPGSALFLEEDLGFNPKNIKLTTATGHAVSEKVYSYQPINLEDWEVETLPKGGNYELWLSQAGDYIATLSDDKGQSVRVGIQAKSDGYDLYTTSAVEKNSVFIPKSEIGFTVKDFKIEQYTGAMYDHKIVDVELSADGVTVKSVGKGDSIFSVRLIGANGEKLYVHGMVYEVSGITAMHYEIATQEQMENSPLR
ncbi:S-layer homology domain-containing protein [Lysinibacillus sp. G4S2]|uniref:S-layer homology domain-containing protein n=1 Tax=Lysinibacillus sp. G4S2 TaxID=3055859 RepID=UPI0025A181E4|nr:S-layer homology domain-containing protein [Lysinibacillus sp. G4S2]MDM5246450.1 S-layer homology domain-containing protein [Lysinibacillus sp. G4S2]